MAPSESQIVIGGDGKVLAATGQLPAGLVDRRLEDCEGLPRDVRAAGAALRQRLRRSGGRMVAETVAGENGHTVQLLAIEALPIRRTPTDLRALLGSKLDVLSFQAAAAGVALVVILDDSVPASVDVDSEKVAWAVTALVGNALRYVQTGSPRLRGSTVTVRAGFDTGPAYVTIEVHDDGPGIPADTVARLLRRDGLNVRGAGLALLLIADVCAAHGGGVDVRSATGVADHGTTVRMTFPVSDGSGLC